MDVEQQFVESSTCHGMFRIANKKYHIVRRGLWFLVVAGCLGFLAYQLFESFSSFLKFKLKTNINLEIHQHLELPAITICNTNLFMKSQLEAFDEELLNKVNVNFLKEAIDFVTNKVGFTYDNDEMWRNFVENKDIYWNLAKKYQKIESEILQNHSGMFIPNRIFCPISEFSLQFLIPLLSTNGWKELVGKSTL